MNKKAATLGLTSILIAVLIGATAFLLSFNAYNEFMTDNLKSIDSSYQGYYANLTNQQGDYLNLANEASDQNKAKSIWEGIVSTANVFVIGLGAVEKFFALPALIGKTITTMNKAIPGFSLITGLLLAILTLYITMSFIKAARGTTDNP